MDLIDLLVDGWRVVWPGALEAMACRYDPADVLKVMPWSSAERRRMRAMYDSCRGPSSQDPEDVCLRAVAHVIERALLSDKGRAQSGQHCDAGKLPLPASRVSCDREILSLFAHPDHPIRRLIRDTLPTQAIIGLDVVRALENEWCITAVPRPEILAIDYDGVPVARIEAIDRELEAAGVPTVWYPSGRGIKAILDAQGDLRTAEANSTLGFHSLSILPDVHTKERWQRALGQPSIDIRSGQQIRVPLGTYKVKDREAPEWVLRYRTRLSDASEKRLFRRLCRGVHNLQEVVALLRGMSRWSGVPLFDMRATYPRLDDGAAWAAQRRELEAAYARRAAVARAEQRVRVKLRHPSTRFRGSAADASSGERPRSSENRPLRVEAAADSPASPPDGRRRHFDRERLTLLEQGDVHGRFRRADGTGTDRSRMSFTVLLWLARTGTTRAEVDALVAAGHLGLAAYTDPSKRRRLDHDWPKAVAAIRAQPWDWRASVIGHALATIPKWRDVQVFLALISFGPHPAPGIRRLSELTGYSVRTAWKSLRFLEGRYIVKRGPRRGPGDRLAQQWECVMPAYDHRAWPRVNTCTITPKACGELVAVAMEMRAACVPLTAGLPVDLRLAKRARVPRLASMSADRRENARASFRRARLRFEADRAQYAHRLARAELAGVSFLPPREAREERCARFRRRLEQPSLTQGEFVVTLERARRLLPPALFDTLGGIQTPDDRWREVNEESRRRRLKRGGRVSRVLALVA